MFYILLAITIILVLVLMYYSGNYTKEAFMTGKVSARMDEREDIEETRYNEIQFGQ